MISKLYLDSTQVVSLDFNGCESNQRDASNVYIVFTQFLNYPDLVVYTCCKIHDENVHHN